LDSVCARSDVKRVVNKVCQLLVYIPGKSLLVQNVQVWQDEVSDLHA